MIRFISTAEASRLLHVSEDTVRRRCVAGRLPAVRVGRLWRIRLDLLGAS